MWEVYYKPTSLGLWSLWVVDGQANSEVAAGGGREFILQLVQIFTRKLTAVVY